MLFEVKAYQIIYQLIILNSEKRVQKNTHLNHPVNSNTKPVPNGVLNIEKNLNFSGLYTKNNTST